MSYQEPSLDFSQMIASCTGQLSRKVTPKFSNATLTTCGMEEREEYGVSPSEVSSADDYKGRWAWTEIDSNGCSSLLPNMGYERVIINNFLEDLKGGKKEKDKVSITRPSELKLKGEDLELLQKKGKIEQLTRLTAVLTDASNTHKLSTPEIQAYDILAVQPTNEKTFQCACSTLEVDIISLDLSERLDFRLKRPLVKLATERGVSFEICYSRAFQDSGVKRQLLSNAMDLVETAKGKNIILSNGSNQAIYLRSPYDVINLAKVIGLNPVQAKNAVTINPRAVVMHAATRKSCKSVVSVAMVSELADSDKWVLDSHKKLMHGSDEESDNDDDDDDDDDEDEEEEEDDKNDNDDEPKNKKIKL